MIFNQFWLQIIWFVAPVEAFALDAMAEETPGMEHEAAFFRQFQML